ncbi:MAG: MATE family efflux transporter [Bacteroides sp.]|nr:MATE family efflux transporter [Eubacterium sp.]MCM1418057.1 MATE family efflux transporter [Roseburia sp.]MCM1462201.1 MATE family efflux transporter [Bacteroides sp.]
MKNREERLYRRETLRTLLRLSVPTVIEQLLSTLLQYVDTAMVGRLGEDATAAVNVTTTVSWLINSVPSAVSVAVLAMIAKAVGSGDHEKIRRVSQQTLLSVPAIGLILGGLSAALSPMIPAWMGAEPSIRETASAYFLIISLPMIFRCSGIVFAAALRATANMRTPMLINFGSNALNAVLNYLLIYRAGLGVVGAALATAISYTLSGILMFAAYRRNRLLRWGWKSFRIDRASLSEMVRISFPVLGTGMASCLGYVVFASLVTGMGNTVFAAHSVAVTVETIFYISGYGLRTATSTMIGMALGEGDQRRFEAVCRLSAVLMLCMMVVSGAVLYFTSLPLMRLFIDSGEAAALGAEMLRIVALSEPFYGLMIVTEGVFYGLGKTRYAFLVETLCMWGIRILLSFFCVRFWGFGLREVWYCMIADNIGKALLFAIPVASKKGRKRLFLGSSTEALPGSVE